ncbi:heme-degrading domain-containing protein [Massilia sp. CFBP9012]|uniref:heme-degrading domain-containing protein n=1 Tax=Massilia sp. CFBP9012 TaxID=3096531 RepID=UPI002A69F1A4|nr:heme-degrading domain-containing protein [Massilia sp. CFBP9012]MDY0975882.1 heme-degrading domain-containing protein [Massilia sp. CFBP9012]
MMRHAGFASCLLLSMATAAAQQAPPPSAMTDIATISLDALLQEERQLQFDRFDQDTAAALGAALVARARSASRPVTLEIKQGDTVLFAHAMPGASPDHADWIRRKNNLVRRTGHSSYYTHNEVRQAGGDHDKLPGLDMRDYAAHGGAYPIVVRGRGAVGTVTASGLPGADDHALVVAALKDHLHIGEQP